MNQILVVFDARQNAVAAVFFLRDGGQYGVVERVRTLLGGGLLGAARSTPVGLQRRPNALAARCKVTASKDAPYSRANCAGSTGN